MHATTMDKARTHLHEPGAEGPQQRSDEMIANRDIFVPLSSTRFNDDSEILSSSTATRISYQNAPGENLPVSNLSTGAQYFPVYNPNDYDTE